MHHKLTFNQASLVLKNCCFQPIQYGWNNYHYYYTLKLIACISKNKQVSENWSNSLLVFITAEFWLKTNKKKKKRFLRKHQLFYCYTCSSNNRFWLLVAWVTIFTWPYFLPKPSTWTSANCYSHYCGNSAFLMSRYLILSALENSNKVGHLSFFICS